MQLCADGRHRRVLPGRPGWWREACTAGLLVRVVAAVVAAAALVKLLRRDTLLVLALAVALRLACLYVVAVLNMPPGCVCVLRMFTPLFFAGLPGGRGRGCAAAVGGSAT